MWAEFSPAYNKGGAVMTYDYKSNFADSIRNFILQKNALGFPYKKNAYHLSHFDSMCIISFPEINTLSKEIWDKWATRRSSERANTFNSRVGVVREFGQYLLRNGEKVHIVLKNLVRKEPKAVPYIYSQEEIAAIWRECDNLQPSKRSPAINLVFPAIVRILYCCGLRPCEARRLKVSDVNLETGSLFIRESKGHKDRIVVMADDIAEYMRNYNTKVSSIILSREYFFSNPTGGKYNEKRTTEIFLEIRKNIGIHGSLICKPKLYGLRHTFATHRLYQWLKEKADLNAMLPYLSAYMGHAQLSDTYYYIHLVPEQFELMSGIELSYFETLLPEVNCCE